MEQHRITQNAGVTITMGAAGWVQMTGTFAGGNSAITQRGGGHGALYGGTVSP